MVRRLPLLVLVVLAMVMLAGCSLLAGDTPTARPTAPTARATAPAAAPTAMPQVAPAGWQGGSVDIEELPAEAIETLRLIAQGGPFPYDQDGATFQNREGLLPAHPRGYYREYTVETPGSPDRGARRIVTGDRGERYYTDDHYDSFRWVVGDPDG
jgi:ribonuclease T1